jgi:hypothetical protein
MDIQSTIQDAFVVTCYFKYIWPNKRLFLILLGTDQLEMLFSIIRCMTHAKNCDFLEFYDRANMAYQVGIFENQYPNLLPRTKLDAPSRKPLDSSKSTSTTDHSSLSEWDGDLETENVDLQSIWNVGYDNAKKLLLSYSYTQNELDLRSSSSITMLNPLPTNANIGTVPHTEESEQQQDYDMYEVCDGHDYDLFGDDDYREQLNDYLDEPNSKAFQTLPDGKFQHKSNAINSILYKVTKLRTTDRLRRVRENDAYDWGQDDDIFNFQNSERTVKLTDLIFSMAKFKSGGVGIVLISINRIKLNGHNVYFVDTQDFNLATFSGKVLEFNNSITGDSIIWSNTYGQSIEVKGKDSLSFDMQTSEMENEIKCYIKIENLKDALQILQSTFAEYEPKPTLDTIVSPYSRENETFFRFKVMESYARGTKFTCKLCKANIDQPLMRLHVAKHIFSGEVLADVCGFCGTYCKTSLGLKLTSGT